jgi:uroporphyrinogen-III synthase
MVKKILVSQPQPTSNKSLYYTISEDFGVEIVFRPFIKVESVSIQEFRQQHINFNDYTAIIFTSRHAIDNYFALAKEARFNVPETMKYFCVTETIALYIQKYTQYRKRKIFFGSSGKIDDLIPSMVKHKNEKYLVPVSDVASNCITELLDKNGLNHTECIMYRTVNNTFSKEELKAFDYDMALFFSPTGIKALKETFPDFKDGDMKIGTFGPATAQAARDAGLSLDIEAPTEKYPSMTSALRHYLQEMAE